MISKILHFNVIMHCPFIKNHCNMNPENKIDKPKYKIKNKHQNELAHMLNDKVLSILW